MTVTDSRRSRMLWLGGAVLAIAVPLAVAGNRFAAFIVGIVFVHILWTAGMNLLYGYTGLVSMMTAGIAGIGAYVTTNLVMSHGWSFWLAMPVSAVGAAAVGVILGLPALRLRGFYFVLSSLVIQSAVTLVFVYFPQFTNGDTGITQIPHPRLWLPGEGAVELKGAAFEILLGLLAFAGVGIVHLIVRSRMGAFIMAIREDDLLAEELGIDVTRYKVLVFFIGSLLMGMGGAFYASYVGFISPRSFDVLVSLNIWLMVAFGGRGTILGPIIGCIILVPIPFVLQDLYMLKDIFYGLLIIVVTVAMPAGVYGTFLQRRRAREQAAVAALETSRRAAERIAAQ